MTRRRLHELLDIADAATGTCRVNWPPDEAFAVAQRLESVMDLLKTYKANGYGLSPIDNMAVRVYLAEWEGWNA